MLSAALLGGCASFSPDGGFDAIQSATQSRIQKDVVWSRDDASRSQTQARIDALLAQPLAADDAVQIALLNNPGLQAAFNTLGIAEADWVAAQRLPNPGFQIARKTRGTEVELERTLFFNLAALLTMPMRADIEQRLFEQTRRTLVLDVLRLAAETRKAWVVAVAAGQTGAIPAAGDGRGRSGRRTGAPHGAGGQLEQVEAGARAVVLCRRGAGGGARRSGEAGGARAAGSPDGPDARRSACSLPDRLPDLPASVPMLPDVEQQAMDSRIDLQVARQQTETLANNLGLTRSTRFINVLELGIINNGSNEAPQQRGYEISFELPLFDWGESRVVAAEARYRQALEQARETAVNARSEVREAYAMQQSQYAIARHLRDEVVPLQAAHLRGERCCATTAC